MSRQAELFDKAADCERAMNVAAVAHARPASTKNCQAWRPWSSSVVSGFSRTFFGSVEVSELIVEPLVHAGVGRSDF